MDNKSEYEVSSHKPPIHTSNDCNFAVKPLSQLEKLRQGQNIQTSKYSYQKEQVFRFFAEIVFFTNPLHFKFGIPTPNPFRKKNGRGEINAEF